MFICADLFRKMWSVVRNECFLKEAKVSLHKTVLLPTLLNGSESWVHLWNDKSMFNGILKMHGKTRRDGAKYEWVLNECGWIPKLNYNIKKC